MRSGRTPGSLRRPRAALAAMAALALAAVLALRIPGALEDQELLAYDLMAVARASLRMPRYSGCSSIAAANWVTGRPLPSLFRGSSAIAADPRKCWPNSRPRLPWGV